MSPDPEDIKKIITVDCRDLEPPEPMVKVLEAVGQIASDEAVLMIHRKFPRLLIPRLKEMGFTCDITEEDDKTFRILIRKEV